MILPIIVAGLAAGAILLIFIALAGSSPVDPVQARLTQLGTMQAKNLEELELQQPFIERTLRPLAARMSGSVSRVTSSSFSERTEQAAGAGRQPGRPAGLGLARHQGPRRDHRRDPVLPAVRRSRSGWASFGGLLLGLLGAVFGYIAPEFWLGRKVKARQKAILLMIPDTLDLLTISVRAGLGFDAALGRSSRSSRARCRTSSDGRWPRSASARRAARRCATSSRAPRSRR